MWHPEKVQAMINCCCDRAAAEHLTATSLQFNGGDVPPNVPILILFIGLFTKNPEDFLELQSVFSTFKQL